MTRSTAGIGESFWMRGALRARLTRTPVPRSRYPAAGPERYRDAARKRALFNPGKRKYAQDRSQLVNWQFADLSAVAPFRYHSVRSLGFLIYAVCDLQNRLRCKFTEAVFEQLMIYFQVSNADDMQRALKVDMINRGFIDDSVKFIKAQDRYQVNSNLAELGLAQNQSLISLNSASYSPQTNNSPNNVEKTKFQVMAETNAMTSLVWRSA